MPAVTFTTLEEALETLRLGAVSYDVTLIPPDPDEQTDEEETENVNDLQEINDVAGTIEIAFEEVEIGEDDVAPMQFSWVKRNPRFAPMLDLSSSLVNDEAKLSMAVRDLSPIGIFNLLWCDVNAMIKKFSERYARQKNCPGFKLQVGELERFFGILLLSGYNVQPNQRSYWSVQNDSGVTAVQEALSRNRFLEIKRWLHACDNARVDPNNKLFKVSSFLNILNKNFQQFSVFSKYLSIDESMLPYFGRNGMRMFIRGKPIRFGYKIWCLCDDSGYLYHFKVYTGKDASTNNQPLGTAVVTTLLSIVPTPSAHEIYFDNFFTSPSLLSQLRQLGFRATGTIRERRAQKAPFIDNSAMKKKPRGYHEVCFERDHNICAIKWHDNSPVCIASNFEGPLPATFCSRWCSKSKKKIQVSCNVKNHV